MEIKFIMNNIIKNIMGKAKIIVNRDLCISAASCVAIAPEIFELDSEGKAYPKISETDDPILIQKAKDAASNCPTNAIQVIEQ